MHSSPSPRAAILAAGVMLVVSTARAQPPAGSPVDLSYAFDEHTVYWPTADPFRLEVVAAGVNKAGFWYAANGFSAAEHGGTHLDAPIHFAEGRRAAAEIPLSDLMGPAIVVDVSERVGDDADYRVDVEALSDWERRMGPIPDAAIVLVRTGWGARWPNPERYLGTAERGPDAVPNLHFPGLHPDAARWLVKMRSVRAIGIDTASIDAGQSTEFLAHRILAKADVPVFENVANLDRLPPRGSWVIALPMKISSGTGGPVRIVAFVTGPGE